MQVGRPNDGISIRRASPRNMPTKGRFTRRQVRQHGRCRDRPKQCDSCSRLRDRRRPLRRLKGHMWYNPPVLETHSERDSRHRSSSHREENKYNEEASGTCLGSVMPNPGLRPCLETRHQSIIRFRSGECNLRRQANVAIHLSQADLTGTVSTWTRDRQSKSQLCLVQEIYEGGPTPFKMPALRIRQLQNAKLLPLGRLHLA
jgi:hypothetical protein